MAPESQEQQNGSTAETAGQEQQEQQQGTGAETAAQETQQQAQQVTIDDSTQLPETHPLVKTLVKQKADLATAKRELAEANANSSKASQLQEELNKRPTQEALDTLQNRYDRLEAFTQAVGLGKALDSRTFTKELFESDKDIKQLVKEWNAANPTQTSAALGGGAQSGSGTGKVDPNELLRIAAGKQ